MLFPGMKNRSLIQDKALHDPKDDSNQGRQGNDHEMGHMHITVEHRDHFDSTADFGSLSLKSQKVWPLDTIKNLISDYGDKIIRAKGLLVTDKGNKLLQLSASGMEIEDYTGKILQSELVIIFKEKDRPILEPGFNQLL